VTSGIIDFYALHQRANRLAETLSAETLLN
jgi:hypothetical protein